MRQVILDTETTGLEVRDGHRVIEIGCLELVGRRLTERNFHSYLNPERASDEGALAVHGLRDEFLADKPKFADVVDDLLAFLHDAEIIIHNAPFDVEFLDAELRRLGREPLASHCARVTDSLRLARELHPGKRNSLDALCERYGVSNQHRTLHGALLDAGLLAEVYLAMTRGQDTLMMDIGVPAALVDAALVDVQRLRVQCADETEVAAHSALLAAIAQETRRPTVWAEAPAAL